MQEMRRGNNSKLQNNREIARLWDLLSSQMTRSNPDERPSISHVKHLAENGLVESDVATSVPESLRTQHTVSDRFVTSSSLSILIPAEVSETAFVAPLQAGSQAGSQAVSQAVTLTQSPNTLPQPPSPLLPLLPPPSQQPDLMIEEFSALFIDECGVGRRGGGGSSLSQRSYVGIGSAHVRADAEVYVTENAKTHKTPLGTLKQKYHTVDCYVVKGKNLFVISHSEAMKFGHKQCNACFNAGNRLIIDGKSQHQQNLQCHHDKPFVGELSIAERQLFLGHTESDPKTDVVMKDSDSKTDVVMNESDPKTDVAMNELSLALQFEGTNPSTYNIFEGVECGVDAIEMFDIDRAGEGRSDDGELLSISPFISRFVTERLKTPLKGLKSEVPRVDADLSMSVPQLSLGDNLSLSDSTFPHPTHFSNTGYHTRSKLATVPDEVEFLQDDSALSFPASVSVPLNPNSFTPDSYHELSVRIQHDTRSSSRSINCSYISDSSTDTDSDIENKEMGSTSNVFYGPSISTPTNKITPKKQRKVWSTAEVDALLKGYQRYGSERNLYSIMLKDPDLSILSINRNNVDLKDKMIILRKQRNEEVLRLDALFKSILPNCRGR